VHYSLQNVGNHLPNNTASHPKKDPNPQARNCSDSSSTSPKQLSKFFLSKKQYGKEQMEYEAVYQNKISSSKQYGIFYICVKNI
jgi:hypothetical protein